MPPPSRVTSSSALADLVHETNMSPAVSRRSTLQSSAETLLSSEPASSLPTPRLGHDDLPHLPLPNDILASRATPVHPLTVPDDGTHLCMATSNKTTEMKRQRTSEWVVDNSGPVQARSASPTETRRPRAYISLSSESLLAPLRRDGPSFEIDRFGYGRIENDGLPRWGGIPGGGPHHPSSSFGSSAIPHGPVPTASLQPTQRNSPPTDLRRLFIAPPPAMVSEGPQRGPIRRTTRACDWCKFKKLKCENENSVQEDGTRKSCIRCAMTEGAVCVYTGIQLKRGPRAGTSRADPETTLDPTTHSDLEGRRMSAGSMTSTDTSPVVTPDDGPIALPLLPPRIIRSNTLQGHRPPPPAHRSASDYGHKPIYTHQAGGLSSSTTPHSRASWAADSHAASYAPPPLTKYPHQPSVSGQRGMASHFGQSREIASLPLRRHDPVRSQPNQVQGRATSYQDDLRLPPIIQSQSEARQSHLTAHSASTGQSRTDVDRRESLFAGRMLPPLPLGTSSLQERRQGSRFSSWPPM